MSWADRIEKALVGGFGDDILTGMLLNYLEAVTPQICLSYIQEGKSFLPEDIDWKRFRKKAQSLHLESKLTVDNILHMLATERGDLVGVIINHKQGIPWLTSQVDIIRAQLLPTWRKVEPVAPS